MQTGSRWLRGTFKVRECLGIRIRHAGVGYPEREVDSFVRLASESIAGHWGFYPVTDDEAGAIARYRKAILDPRAVLVAEGPQGNPIGFALALPDANLLRSSKDAAVPHVGAGRGSGAPGQDGGCPDVPRPV